MSKHITFSDWSVLICSGRPSPNLSSADLDISHSQLGLDLSFPQGGVLTLKSKISKTQSFHSRLGGTGSLTPQGTWVQLYTKRVCLPPLVSSPSIFLFPSPPLSLSPSPPPSRSPLILPQLLPQGRGPALIVGIVWPCLSLTPYHLPSPHQNLPIRFVVVIIGKGLLFLGNVFSVPFSGRHCRFELVIEGTRFGWIHRFLRNKRTKSSTIGKIHYRCLHTRRCYPLPHKNKPVKYDCILT